MFRSFMAGVSILVAMVVIIWIASSKPPVESPSMGADSAGGPVASAVLVAPPVRRTAQTDVVATRMIAAPVIPAPPPLPIVRAVTLGRLIVPVAGVRPTDLVDTYQQARGQGRLHDAIDIMAPHNAAVLAAADGTILKLFSSLRGGITLYQLANDQHTLYYYAHLDRYAAGMTEHKTVHQGEVIGYVGDTGNAGAGNYHLHFEVLTTTDPKRYWGGIPQNPYPLLH